MQYFNVCGSTTETRERHCNLATIVPAKKEKCLCKSCNKVLREIPTQCSAIHLSKKPTTDLIATSNSSGGFIISEKAKQHWDKILKDQIYGPIPNVLIDNVAMNSDVIGNFYLLFPTAETGALPRYPEYYKKTKGCSLYYELQSTLYYYKGFKLADKTPRSHFFVSSIIDMNVYFCSEEFAQIASDSQLKGIEFYDISLFNNQRTKKSDHFITMALETGWKKVNTPRLPTKKSKKE